MTPFDWTIVIVIAILHLGREMVHRYQLKRKAQIVKDYTARLL